MQVAVADVPEKSNGAQWPCSAQCAGDTDHVLFHIAHRQTYIECVKRMKVPDDVLEVFAAAWGPIAGVVVAILFMREWRAAVLRR